MPVAIVVACIAMGVVLGLVWAGQGTRRARAALRATGAELGLTDDGHGSWSGIVDGLEVQLYASLADLRERSVIEPFPFGDIAVRSARHDPERADARRIGVAPAAAAVRVPDAPEGLTFGATHPCVGATQPLGDPDFDRTFAVSSAPPEILAYLDPRRRAIFLERPSAWFVAGWLVVGVAEAAPHDQAAHVTHLVATAYSLAETG